VLLLVMLSSFCVASTKLEPRDRGAEAEVYYLEQH
jgi:hypothetical protein